MVTALVVLGMLVVLAGFLGLAFTNSTDFRDKHPDQRALAVTAWWAILIVGWGAFAYIAFGTAGGLDGASAWIASRGIVMRIASWILLLPWMSAIAIWRLDWIAASRASLIVALAALTFLLAIQLTRRRVF